MFARKLSGGSSPDQIKSLDWKARHLKILKKYNREDAQIEEIDEIIDECLAKIATYLT
ncbi:toxin-antitoxin system, addiction module toxin component MazF [Geobacillus sp. DSP4a]|nr:toxin-antitoxin system, addiction module toxin component MazF [Geobacillus sp. LC300]NNV00636.1 toxin-antitoxin system, addiction module toxin component MazF [Geobacillus sp. DSP4a]